VSRHQRLIRLALVSVLALSATAAGATQMMHLDTQALVTGSNDIVIGRVESVTPRWNATRTKIFTDVSLRVSRTLKGIPGDRITITQIGGEVDGVRYTVPGCAVFTPGEEALLFVWRDRTGQARVNGLGQGKFDIRRDATSGEATVQRSVPGLAVSDARRLRLTGADEAAPRIPLDDLVREIQRVLATEGGR
jgi:hypothetical protein